MYTCIVEVFVHSSSPYKLISSPTNLKPHLPAFSTFLEYNNLQPGRTSKLSLITLFLWLPHPICPHILLILLPKHLSIPDSPIHDLFRPSISLPFWLEISNRICGLPYCSHTPKILPTLQLETEYDILLLKMIQYFLINKKMVSKLVKMAHNALPDLPLNTASLYSHSSCI